jgi:hypothetical protein
VFGRNVEFGGAAGFAVQGRECHGIQPFSREGARGGGEIGCK